METLEPQIDLSSLPAYPMLKPWYRQRVDEVRALFHYGYNVATFTGRAVAKLFPHLLPLLDGTRSLDALRAEFGDAFVAVANALAELQRRNLLTDGPRLSDDIPAAVVDAVYFAAGNAMRELSPAQAFDAMQCSSVTLFGGARIVGLLAESLRASGVGSVRIVEEVAALQGADVAIVAPAAADVASVPQWNETALRDGHVWLAILPFDGEKCIVGPLHVPSETACHHCFIVRRRSAVGYGAEFLALDATPSPFPAPAAVDLIAAGVATTLLTHWLVGRDGNVPGRYYAIAPQGNVGLTRHHLYRVPRCAACGAQRRQGLPQPWSRA